MATTCLVSRGPRMEKWRHALLSLLFMAPLLVNGSVVLPPGTPDNPAPPCSHPGDIEHGLTDWNGTSNIAKFACYQGYYLVGPPSLKCRYGHWYSDANVDRPTCKPVVCSHPNIEHGSLISGYTIKYKTNEQAVVTCDQGYQLRHNSNNKIVCREDGSWAALPGSEFPMCEERGCYFNQDDLPDKGSIEVNGIKIGPHTYRQTNDDFSITFDDGPLYRDSGINTEIQKQRSGEGNGYPSGSGQPGNSSSSPGNQQPPSGGDLARFDYHNDDVEVLALPRSGVYRPGTVLKHKCLGGWLVVPIGASTRVCRRGRWDGQRGTCVKKVPRMKARGNCPPPPLINNGYFLSERYSGEKPYVLPVSGSFQQSYEVGAVARYHCNEGYRLLMLFGQDLYRCTAAGVWTPKQPPVCISLNNNVEPLSGMMCPVPEEVAYASYKAVEGVVTPNGALHGTILEYSCNIGYRDNILPCLPSRRTCHAGDWVGSLPSCAPFEFCPPVPRIMNGYLATPREDAYRLHSIVKYGCDRGFWMAGVDTMQCQATGCWEPNALPRCIDENILPTWNEETSGMSIVALLSSLCAALVLISVSSAVCGVVACRRKRTPPPTGPAHWSTHVTVTPNCRGNSSSSSTTSSGSSSSGSSSGASTGGCGHNSGNNNTLDHSTHHSHRSQTLPHTTDRVALIAFADQEAMVLPSYEEALRDGVVSRAPVTRVGTTANPQPTYNRHNHNAHRRGRHPQDHLPVQINSGYATNGRDRNRNRRRAEPDTISHHSVGWPARQASTSTSQSASLRSGSVQSVETVGNTSNLSDGNSNGTTNTDNTLTTNTNTSQTPSCRALAGSLASFDTCSALNTEGVPLLEENEFETPSNSLSEQAETASAYSEASNKSK